MRVRPERAGDWDAIADVTTAAFGKEREARMIAAIRASDEFVAELSLVAEDGDEVVGHVLLSYVVLEETGQRLLELGPIGVRPDRQRQGVGSLLIHEALTRAEVLKEPLVLVLGHPSYYPRFGFRRASEIGIVPAQPDIPDEAYMAFQLQSYDPSIRGRVVFPPAYSAS